MYCEKFLTIPFLVMFQTFFRQIGYSKGTSRTLGHSGTPSTLGYPRHLGTLKALGHSSHLGTLVLGHSKHLSTLKALKHSDTQGTWALEHSGTQMTLEHSSIKVLRHVDTRGTKELYLADSVCSKFKITCTIKSNN